MIDPETYTWDSLDSDFLARLNFRQYISMSRERRLNIPPTVLPKLSNSEHLGHEGADPLHPPSSSQSSHDLESSLLLSDYIEAQDPQLHVDASSIFEAKTPGAMTLEEVASEIELGRWRLQVSRLGRIVRLEVRGLFRSSGFMRLSS